MSRSARQAVPATRKVSRRLTGTSSGRVVRQVPPPIEALDKEVFVHDLSLTSITLRRTVRTHRSKSALELALAPIGRTQALSAR